MILIMFFAISISLGVIIGFLVPWQIPLIYSKYISVAILAALDSLFGGIKANLDNTYDSRIFLSGFLINALLAGFFAYLGDLLGLDLYLAAVIVFGSRIFQNIAIMRRMLILKSIKTKKMENSNE